MVLGLANITEASMKYGGPIYVALGFGLILGVAYAYLSSVLPVLGRKGFTIQALHFAFGAVLFCNIMFNYWLCVVTKPGSTGTLNEVRSPALDWIEP